jgi:type IV secretion system protein VirB9
MKPGTLQPSAAVIAIAVGLLSLVPPAHAETAPTRGRVDSRIRTATYNPEDVIRLRGFVGYQITIQFAEGEEFVRLGAGDSDMLDVGKERNYVFIKPKVARSATNLTLLTTQRHYHFAYSAANRAPNPRREEVTYALRFLYPQDEALRASVQAEQRRIDSRLAKASDTRTRNGDYWFCGNPNLKPVSAYDDGVQTRIRFGARAEMPAIFLKNADQTESLVNASLQGDEVVIHRVAPQFILRRGALVGCVVNKSFDGSGTRLDSGTVSPGVRRDTVGS